MLKMSALRLGSMGSLETMKLLPLDCHASFAMTGGSHVSASWMDLPPGAAHISKISSLVFSL